MAALTVQTAGETAIDIDDSLENADSASGDTAANPNGQLYLYMENNAGNGDAATVTITAQKTTRNVPGYGPLTKANLVISLADGAQAMVGPLPKQPWNNSAGSVAISYGGDGAAAVDIVAIEGSKGL